MTHPALHGDAPRALSRAQVLLFAIASGVAVGNAYLAHPLLDEIAADLGVGAAAAGAVVTVTQAGLALGLLLIVPLGDVRDRRRLIGTLTLAAVAGLALVASAQSPVVLFAGAAVVGASAVATQVLVPYAATLSLPDQRGRVVGVVTGGVVTGILLARTAAGAIAELGGWRAVYAVAAATTLLVAALLWRALPSADAAAVVPYRRLVASVATLAARTPVLRLHGLLAFLVFAAFSTLWTALVLPLSAPPHGLSHATIGLFGLAGAAGAAAAARAGRLADRGRGRRTAGVALALLLLSWLPISLLDRSLVALAVGAVLLDLAVQAVHVTNQSTILGSLPEAARSRATAAYMLFYSAGSAAGAIAATAVYADAGWAGVCVQGAVLSAAALGLWAAAPATGAPSAASPSRSRRV